MTGTMTQAQSGLAGASASTPASTGGAGVPEVSPRQAEQWLKRGEALLIDVREPDEHAREHIKGSVLMPLSTFDARQAIARAHPSQRIVFQCKSGRRSGDAARMAMALGAGGVSIQSMAGGIEAWKREGLAVEVNAGAPGLSVMRQVQLVIGIGVLASTALGWLVHPAFLGLAAFFGAGLTVAGATGTCALATILGKMPWNRVAKSGGSCCGGSCG